MLRGASVLFSLSLALFVAGPAGAQEQNAILLEEGMPDFVADMLTPAAPIRRVRGPGSEEVAARGEAFAAAVPVERMADRVLAIDLFSVPFLFETDADRDRILDRDSTLRVAFDTSAMAFGLRIIGLLPVGYEGVAFTGDPASDPAGLLGRRVLADGPSERGLAGALEAMPVERGRHDAGFLAAWEVTGDADYGTYLDLRQAVSLFAVLVREEAWQALSEDQQTAWVTALRAIEAQARQDLEGRHQGQLAALRAAGVTVTAVSADQRETWRGATAGLARSTYLGEGRQLARVYLRTVDRMQSHAD